MILAVDTDTFWGIIATARAQSGPGKPFHQALTDCLAAGTEQDILQYQDRFDELHAALYRWDVWAAAYLIGGGCSDDGFIDFRAGLIAQGRDWYERAAATPDSLAGHPAVARAAGPSPLPPLFDEMVNYAASWAFERVTGTRDGFHDARTHYRGPRVHGGHSPAGEDFDFDDAQEMRGRLPRLSAIFLPNGIT
jgi:hypothetical protein